MGGTTIAALAEELAGQPRFLWMAVRFTFDSEFYDLYFLNTRGGGTSEQGWWLRVRAGGVEYFRDLRDLCLIQNQSALPFILNGDITRHLVSPPP